MDLNTIWFILIIFLFAVYAALDGFDFGVGIIQLFTSDKKNRPYFYRAIGPVWDGNEVWLIAGAGSLFAAFPRVYATVFSSLYTPLMLLLFALIFRAVSLEIREKFSNSRLWISIWDVVLCISSIVAPFVMGVAVANILKGIPLDDQLSYTGSFLSLLSLYPIFTGLFVVIVFIMHGALYIGFKTKEHLRHEMKKWCYVSWCVYIYFLFLFFFMTVSYAPHLFINFTSRPIAWLLLLLITFFSIFIFKRLRKERFFQAFIGSFLSIILVVSLLGLCLFPGWVPSSIDSLNSLNIYDSSSSKNTLFTMLIICLIGMPLVIGYTIYTYRVFKGKVDLEQEGY